MASPGVEDLDLNDSAAKTTLGAKEGDEIQLPNGLTTITYKYKDGKWQYWGSVNAGGFIYQTWKDVTEPIPAGQGFWYLNTGSSATVEW